MGYLTYIKDFDSYFGKPLVEGLNSNEEAEMYRIFSKAGDITMADGTKVAPSTIWEWIQSGFYYISSEFSVLYKNFATRMNIILFRHCSGLNTMAVDGHLNLYINAEFVYTLSKVASPKVTERSGYSDLARFIGAILMHELYHVVYNHVGRGKDWVFKHNSTWDALKNDLNLASDLEVNQTLMNAGVVTENELVEKIKGIYLRSELKDKNSGKTWTAIRTMEDILSDEKIMNVLRAMHPEAPNGLINKDNEPDKDKETIKTTPEWDKGYKDAWQKFAELFRKYGHSGVWKKLQEESIINAIGEYDPEHNVKEIMSMEFLTIKSFDEFVNDNAVLESVELGGDGASTYEEGFNSAVEKIMNALRASMMEGDGEDGGEGGEGDGLGKNIESNLNDDDLDPINIPRKMKKNKKGGDGSDTPGQIGGGETDDDDNEDENEDNKNQKGGGGSTQKKKASDEQVRKNKDKLMNGSSGGSSTGEEKSNTPSKQNDSIGGTGSFIDSSSEAGFVSSGIKESGYDKSAMERISKIIKQSQTENSEDRINYARDRYKVEDRTGAGKFMRDLEQKIDQDKTKKMWKEIMKDFMKWPSRHANSSKKVKGQFKKWTVTKPYRNVQGIYNTVNKKTSLDPQDLNVYVDVSGSVSGAMGLLRSVCQSLVIFTKEFEYSNINICPWANTINGVHPVKSLHEQNSDENVLNDIMDIIARGEAECGGGTDEEAAMSAMIEVMEQSLNDPEKIKKDDVHVIITDGEFNYDNIESRMESMISNYLHNYKAGDTAVRNTFWILYNAEYMKSEWRDEIKKGKIIFLNTNDFQK